MEPKDRRAILDGAVRLRRDDLTLTGEHAVADFVAQKQEAAPKRRKPKAAPEAAALGQTVRRFEVIGDVRVARGDRTAEAEQGVLDTDLGTLVLTGTDARPPVLRDGGETLSGERIVLRLDSEDVDVVRPRVVLHRAVAEDGKAAPVRVEALKMFLDKSERVAKFSDDVVVKQADATVKSPRMDAFYDGDGQLTLLQMRGGVDLRQGDRRATGQNADYDARTKVVVLTGDPRVYDRGDVLTGDRIDVSLASREVRVERAKGRFRPEVHRDEGTPQ
jgi:lipopolysaccharide transport protein LptA